MHESAIVRKIIEAVREKFPRAYVRKLSDRYTRGLPDILIVWPSPWGAEILFVETKVTGGKQNKIQQEEKLAILRANGDFIVARNAEEVLDRMDGTEEALANTENFS